jgi:hypothetical protein
MDSSSIARGKGGCRLGVVSTVAIFRKARVLEGLAVLAIIMAYIWKLRFAHPMLWIPVAALILASHTLARSHAQETRSDRQRFEIKRSSFVLIRASLGAGFHARVNPGQRIIASDRTPRQVQPPAKAQSQHEHCEIGIPH